MPISKILFLFGRFKISQILNEEIQATQTSGFILKYSKVLPICGSVRRPQWMVCFRLLVIQLQSCHCQQQCRSYRDCWDNSGACGRTGWKCTWGQSSTLDLAHCRPLIGWNSCCHLRCAVRQQTWLCQENEDINNRYDFSWWRLTQNDLKRFVQSLKINLSTLWLYTVSYFVVF